MSIIEYIESLIPAGNEQLVKIIHQQDTRNDTSPNIGLQAGRFLSLLIQMIQAKRVLEFGTCLGYSTVWLAEALRTTGGKLISIEQKKEFLEITRKNIVETGLSEFVDLIWGNANIVIDQVEGPFDLILQDSDKKLYPQMLDRCIEITRKNGLIVADDALFKPMGVEEKLSEPIHKYNEQIFSDKRLFSTILPIGDGVAISVKLTD
jgi:predicted O-methyltransferase YrrM